MRIGWRPWEAGAMGVKDGKVARRQTTGSRAEGRGATGKVKMVMDGGRGRLEPREVKGKRNGTQEEERGAQRRKVGEARRQANGKEKVRWGAKERGK